MAYTPTNWKRGDIVTSEKMNKIEAGIASAAEGSGESTEPFVAKYDGTSTNVSGKQMFGAFNACRPCYIKTGTSYSSTQPVIYMEEQLGSTEGATTYRAYTVSFTHTNAFASIAEYTSVGDGMMTLTKSYRFNPIQ